MKILAVCGFGVGSSMVLKMTLEKVAREMGVNVTVENTDIATAKATPADAYFTSAELRPDIELSTDKPVYAIKRYMDKQEVARALEQLLEERKK